MTRWGDGRPGRPRPRRPGGRHGPADPLDERVRPHVSASRSDTTACRAAAAARIAGTSRSRCRARSPARPRGTVPRPRARGVPQHTDPGWPSPLVRGRGQRRPSPRAGGAGRPRRRRRRKAGRSRLPRDLGHGLDRGDLVVGGLDADDRASVRSRSSSRIRPRASTARTRVVAPDHRAACRTAECSKRRGHLVTGARAAMRPSSPRCTAWVPEAVNVTSSGRTPSASAVAARALSRTSRADLRVVDPPGAGERRAEGGLERLSRCRVGASPDASPGRPGRSHAANLAPDREPTYR